MCGTACTAVILISVIFTLTIGVIVMKFIRGRGGGGAVLFGEEELDTKAKPLLERVVVEEEEDPVMPVPDLEEVVTAVEDVEIGRNGELLKLHASYHDEDWGSGVVINPEPGGLASEYQVPPGLLTTVNGQVVRDVPQLKSLLKEIAANQVASVVFGVRPTAVLKHGVLEYHIKLHDAKQHVGIDLKTIGFSVHVVGVSDRSPAQRHGVRPGKILKVNNRIVTDKESVIKILKAWRDAGHTTVKLTMPNPDGSETALSDDSQTQTAMINPHFVSGLGFIAKDTLYGVAVASQPTPGSAFDKAGILQDAILHSIGGQPLRTTSDLPIALSRVKSYAEGFPLDFTNPQNPPATPLPPPPQLDSRILNACPSETSSFDYPPCPTDTQNPEVYAVGAPRLAPVVKGAIDVDGTKQPGWDVESQTGSTQYTSFQNLRNKSVVTFEDRQSEVQGIEEEEEDEEEDQMGAKTLENWKPVVGMQIKTRPKSKVGKYTESQKGKSGCKATIRKIVVQRKEEGDQTYVYLGFGKKGTMTWRWEDCSCVQHRLGPANLLRPSGCDKCERLMWSLGRDSAFACVDCRNRYHKNCGQSLVRKGGAVYFDPNLDSPGPNIEAEPVHSEEDLARQEVLRCENETRIEAVALSGGRDVWRDNLTWKQRLEFINRVEANKNGEV